MASKGMRKLMTISEKTALRPRNSMTESAKAAVAQTARPPSTVTAATKMELKMARAKGLRQTPSTCSSVGSVGIQVQMLTGERKRKISSSVLKALVVTQ